jgi:hypothetical protein
MEATMAVLRYLYAVVGVLTLTACEQEVTKPQPVENQAAATNDAAATATDVATVLPLNVMRTIPAEPADTILGIEDVSFSTGIAGNFAMATIRYGGGCKPHEFKAYWDNSWIKTKPPGINLVIRHNANGDTCKAIKTTRVQIDLAEPLKSERELWLTIGDGKVVSERLDVVRP